MKPGFFRCSVCGNITGLQPNGQVRKHFAKLGQVGAGFRGLSQYCPMSLKKLPEGETK